MMPTNIPERSNGSGAAKGTRCVVKGAQPTFKELPCRDLVLQGF